MNPFASRISGNSWVLPVSGLCLVLGFMVRAAAITDTTRNDRLSALDKTQQFRIGLGTIDLQQQYLGLQKDFEGLQGEVSKLRTENDNLQKTIGTSGPTSKLLNQSLQDAKAFAGLTAVDGPGVKITLIDSKKASFGPIQENIIHDTDILSVTNELFASGAEAIDVNGQRIVGTSAVRCAGPIVFMDGVRIASPIIVRAIGDAKTLMGGLNIPEGVLDQIRRTDPSMVQVEEVKNMRIGAYSGSTDRKYAKTTEGK